MIGVVGIDTGDKLAPFCRVFSRHPLVEFCLVRALKQFAPFLHHRGELPNLGLPFRLENIAGPKCFVVVIGVVFEVDAFKTLQIRVVVLPNVRQ